MSRMFPTLAAASRSARSEFAGHSRQGGGKTLGTAPGAESPEVQALVVHRHEDRVRAPGRKVTVEAPGKITLQLGPRQRPPVRGHTFVLTGQLGQEELTGGVARELARRQPWIAGAVPLEEILPVLRHLPLESQIPGEIV